MDSKHRKTVVLGLLGSVLDAGRAAKRWDRWRPSVDLCRQEDLAVDRFELLLQRRSKKLARVIAEDVVAVSPGTEVRQHELEFSDPWDFAEVYARLREFADA